MVYALVCFGEDRRIETMNLLNDLRNLNQKVFVLTNIDLHLNHFQFYNVVEVKTNTRDWTCFERFKIIKYAFDNSDDEFVYYLDSDSRFFDFREEKFDSNRFELLLKTIDFDIMCPSFLFAIKHQLEKPDLNENKNIRNFKFGYDNILNYLKLKSDKYYEIIENPTPLETVLIFRRSVKLYDYMNELIIFSNMLIIQDINNGRIHKACASGFAMAYFSYVYNIKIIENKISHHFFKGNFIKEVFPYNQKIDIKDNIFLKKN